MTHYYISRTCRKCANYDEDFDKTGNSPPTPCQTCRRLYPDLFEEA